MRIALLCLVLAGCVQQRSARCKQVCAREYECATPHGAPFDEKQCIAVCSELEASPQHTARVATHADCVLSHPACSDVLECR